MIGRSPFDEMERLFDRMSHADERMWGRMMGRIDVDVADYDDEFVVMADVPGFERDDIDVTVHDGTLTISAEREQAADMGSEESQFVRRERRSESVTRRVDLPAAVMEDEATATYTNGVLTITLPKEAETTDDDGHQIDIE